MRLSVKLGKRSQKISSSGKGRWVRKEEKVGEGEGRKSKQGEGHASLPKQFPLDLMTQLLAQMMRCLEDHLLLPFPFRG